MLEKSDDKEAIKKVHDITKSIFDKTLQETKPNHTMVDENHPKIIVTYLLQIHNHRRYFGYLTNNFNPNKPSNHTLEKYKSMVGNFNINYSYEAVNYGKEHSYKNFMNCTIRVKKKTIEIINNFLDKQWIRIDVTNIQEANERIDFYANDMEERTLKSLKTFIELHGGSSDFKVIPKDRPQEIGLHGDDWLDKIPKEMIIYDTHFKKPYKEKTELYTYAGVKNFISNRVVEKLTPEIASSMNELGVKLGDKIDKMNEAITDKLVPAIEAQVEQGKLLTEQISLHLGVQRDTQVFLKESTNVQKESSKNQEIMNKTLNKLSDKIEQIGTPVRKGYDPKIIIRKIFKLQDTLLYEREIAAMTEGQKEEFSNLLFGKFKKEI